MSFEHIFDEMEVTAQPFALCELQGRSTLGLKGDSGAILHYVLAGEGELILKDQPPIPLQPGTLALVPTLRSHTLHGHGTPGHPLPTCRPAALHLASYISPPDNGGNGDDTGVLLAICSHINIGVRGTHGLVNLVREPLCADTRNEIVMRGLIDGLLRELSIPTLGGSAMVRALLTQCAIQLMRGRISAGDKGLNWMTALTDEKLWKSLQLMLDEPGHFHSVESLADAAGMSRSSFAARFAAAYGHGPMELLRELRMQQAASLLARTEMPVKRIAHLAGFKSRSAFSRTFTKMIGMSPQAYRK